MSKKSLSVVTGLTITSLVILDVVSGTLMIVWPALWHEWIHPGLTAPALFTWQYLGALFLTRGIYIGCQRWRRRPVGPAIWWLECPGDLLLWWRLNPIEGGGAPFYLIRGGVALLAAWLLESTRCVQTSKTSSDQE